MAIVGFNFVKMHIDRGRDAVKSKIDIKNNVGISNVEEGDLSLGTSTQKVAKFTFDYDVNYTPKIGSMKFTGEVFYLAEKEKIDKLVEGWKKDKKVPQEIMTGILNTVLNKCNIQALILSQQVNLPPPIQLPRVKAEAPKK